jgi:hypothetical protein
MGFNDLHLTICEVVFGHVHDFLEKVRFPVHHKNI